MLLTPDTKEYSNIALTKGEGMKKLLIGLMIAMLGSLAWGESYLYLEQKKSVNGNFEYRLPKLELNTYKKAGKFFGNPCLYLSELEFGLVYTAPRQSMFGLNHHSIEAEWSLGVEVGAFWATYSLGGRHYLPGNDSGIPEGLDLFNTARVGIAWK